MNNDNKSFWINAYGQLRNIISTIGLAIALAVGEYLIDNQDSGWTWKAVVIAAVGAFVKYFLTKDDHVKTAAAVKKAVVETAITTQEVIEKAQAPVDAPVIVEKKEGV